MQSHLVFMAYGTHKKYDVLVLGAGIHGLSAAYHLSSRPHLKIGLIEQFSLGNAFGGIPWGFQDYSNHPPSH